MPKMVPPRAKRKADPLDYLTRSLTSGPVPSPRERSAAERAQDADARARSIGAERARILSGVLAEWSDTLFASLARPDLVTLPAEQRDRILGAIGAMWITAGNPSDADVRRDLMRAIDTAVRTARRQGDTDEAACIRLFARSHRDLASRLPHDLVRRALDAWRRGRGRPRAGAPPGPSRWEAIVDLGESIGLPRVTDDAAEIEWRRMRPRK